nr:uncharacterized protein LOC129435191 [Misgurnus anguillicaudatus]
MPKSCCVTMCTANKLKNPDLSFYKLPSRKTQPLRRQKWIQAIRREASARRMGKLWDPDTKHTYVCSKHFVTGSKNDDESHPDYIPTLLPHKRAKQATSLLRLQNLTKRHQVAATTAALPITESPLEPTTENPPGPTSENPPEPTSENPPEPTSEIPHEPTSELIDQPTTEQRFQEIQLLREERNTARRERDEAQQRYKASSLKEDNEKCKLMTGVSWEIFGVIHTFLAQYISFSLFCKLTSEDQLFLTLLKLRQNPTTPVLAQMFGLNRTTVLRVFTKWVDVMYAKMTFLIRWPDRECIQDSIPSEMRLQFPRLTSIIDCFEIRIERPKKLKARAKTYSNYKKWTTAKYFIACHPSGCITFLSKGWGGRASDVHIVRQSGFLSSSYHKPGDQILADRGFTLVEDFAVLGAHLVMPAFTRGRKQLPGKDVEESRVKSNIRIHIERVIGVLKGRFHILDGPIPMWLVKSLMDERQNKEAATIDKIVHVCAALVNMSNSVV